MLDSDESVHFLAIVADAAGLGFEATVEDWAKEGALVAHDAAGFVTNLFDLNEVLVAAEAHSGSARIR
jgi:hypothetical protein